MRKTIFLVVILFTMTLFSCGGNKSSQGNTTNQVGTSSTTGTYETPVQTPEKPNQLEDFKDASQVEVIQ